jgi:hypothetical protein
MLPAAGQRRANDARFSGCYHGLMDQISVSAPKIICCEVLRHEIEAVAAGHETEFIDGALHNHPDRMRAELQQRIDATVGSREILLCCGRCSNGTVGLQSGRHRLVLPAVDDCISLLLGSRQRYLEEHATQPGTYYYTRGWVDYIADPYKEYLAIIPKYGAEKAARLARMILQNYTRVAVIDTPGVPGLDDACDYLETARRFYELPLVHLIGSLRFVQKLVTGPYDDEFIVVRPGEVLDEPRFWALASI